MNFQAGGADDAACLLGNNEARIIDAGEGEFGVGERCENRVPVVGPRVSDE